jgi:di/tripeptidase
MSAIPSLGDDALLGRLSLEHLERVVAIDSQSDETSSSIPSTPGQAALARDLQAFYQGLGAQVSQDDSANVLALLPGRGAGVHKPPLALMIHLDTARGTRAVPGLHVLEGWDGGRVPFPRNADIQVDLETYPCAGEWRGQDLVHGDGDLPFGLDDKLGLAHCMTLARLVVEHDLECPPLLLIGRPDEEIGRMEAVEGLAEELVRRGVRYAYTIDGLLPFEINVENFNAAGASLLFPSRPFQPAGQLVSLRIGGVNTHGATAMAEGYRAATRLATQIDAACAGATCVWFHSDTVRDCDADTLWEVSDLRDFQETVVAVMGPHLARGASVDVGPGLGMGDAAVGQMLRFLRALYGSDPGFVVHCEESSGHQGYTNPYRARMVQGGLKLDLRLRDFRPDGIDQRVAHLREIAGEQALEVLHQYVNMGPRLAQHPELAAWASQACEELELPVRIQPIRGGTGVDPFLDRGIPVANLGTGYFAPESEKEFTSVQMMGRHARWLVQLVGIIARS